MIVANKTKLLLKKINLVNYKTYLEEDEILVLTLLAALQSLASLDMCKYNRNGWPFCLLLLLVPHVVWDDLEYKQWGL